MVTWSAAMIEFGHQRNKNLLGEKNGSLFVEGLGSGRPRGLGGKLAAAVGAPARFDVDPLAALQAVFAGRAAPDNYAAHQSSRAGPEKNRAQSRHRQQRAGQSENDEKHAADTEDHAEPVGLKSRLGFGRDETVNAPDCRSDQGYPSEKLSRAHCYCLICSTASAVCFSNERL